MATKKKDQNKITEDVIFSDNHDEEAVLDNTPNEMIAYLDRITEKVFSKNDIEVKTELNDTQIVKFSRARSYAKVFSVDIINDIIDDICIFSVSKNRKSRKEFTQLAQGMGSYLSGVEPEQKTLLNNLVGR